MKINTYPNFKYQKLLILPAGLFILNVSCQINPEKDNSKLPNIIFFLADDQNNETLGCYGHPIIQTPNFDLPVTFLDWMNIDISEVYEGNSLLPLVNNNYSQWRQEFFCESLAPNAGIPKWEGIRTENYKYARYFENNYEFFYDLKKDPDELKNFISDPGYTEVINKLRDRCNYYINTFEQKAERYKFQEVF